MRKVIVGAFVSLDGVIQAPGGPEEDRTGGFRFGGWVAPLADNDPVFGEEIGALFEQPYDLLLGRRTYEIFAAHWPFAEGGPDDGIARQFNGVTKYVATRSGEVDTSWNRSVVLGDGVADVARLKRETGPALVTQGSSELVQSLLEAGLVDEIRLFTFPVLLGAGKRLFDGAARPSGLTLTHSRVSPTGMVAATYVVEGGVKTGDFETHAPSRSELARRKKWSRDA